MNDIAVRVENLGKLYRIGQFAGYKTIRETLTNVMSAPLRRLRQTEDGRRKTGEPSPQSPVPGHGNTLWALKDVSFEVKRGEAVGIIGRNGSGKSTLLKILSRITAPTDGRVEIYGRVGSLLEVGTGFHPELTGRENIYLNGAVIGMKKAEVERKFDEIVAFAEIEKFLDTPVKRYSSGMYVRLAFAVSAHLEPEILLVDEVLAVGDAAFQKKCLGKMGDVTKEGRTVLFVSHNMASVSGLCKRGIVLESGKLTFEGNVDSAIGFYGSLIETVSQSRPLRDRQDRIGDGRLRFTSVSFSTPSRGVTDTFFTGEDVLISVSYETNESRPLSNVSVSIPFNNSLGLSIFMCWTRMTGQDFEIIPPRGRFVAKIHKLPLREGRYNINLYCEVNGILADWVREASTLNVIEGDFFHTGITPPTGHGVIVVEHDFSLDSA